MPILKLFYIGSYFPSTNQIFQDIHSNYIYCTTYFFFVLRRGWVRFIEKILRTGKMAKVAFELK